MDLTSKRDAIAIGRRTKREHMFSFLMAISSVLSVYAIYIGVAISFGEILFIVFMLANICVDGRLRIYKNGWLQLFLLYTFVATMIVSLVNGLQLKPCITRMIRNGSYWILIFVFAYTYLDFACFVKWARRLCVILSILILVQQAVYILTGYLVPGFILGAPSGMFTTQDFYDNAVRFASYGYLKAPGFMTEGAHCAQMLFFGKMLLLEGDLTVKKENMKYLVLFSIGSLLTLAASAVVFVAFFWGVLAMVMLKRGRLRLLGRLLILVFILLLVLIFLLVLGQIDLMPIVDRVINAVSTSSADGSATARMYRGYTFWGGLPFQYQLFGIGSGNYEQMYTLYSGAEIVHSSWEYMNSNSAIMVNGGVVGALLYLAFYIDLFRKCNVRGKMMILGLFLSNSGASLYPSFYWSWLMTGVLFSLKANTSWQVKRSWQQLGTGG